MRFESLLSLVRDLPCFDLPLLVQAAEGNRASVRVQLSRWMKQGKIIGLRRGQYALAETYQRAPHVPALLANILYRPSYLSGLWALGYYDLVPERVLWITSVTSRVPRRFENPLGVFDYRNIKRECFFGSRTVNYGGTDILVAEPEKALLDHWHLSPGDWTTNRLDEMRYQHMGVIRQDKLIEYGKRFRSPRLDRAVQRWSELAQAAEEGTVAL